MLKKQKIVLLTSLTILLTSCLKGFSAQESILYFSGVKIPDEATLLYRKRDTGFGSQGHGPHYALFSFTEEPSDFLTSDYEYGGNLLYTDKDGTKHYSDIISGTLDFSDGRLSSKREEEITDFFFRFKINEQYLPNWDEEYKYFEHRLNLFVYFKETMQLAYYYQGY